MILRKPYAFFIKKFKVIHAILAVLISFVLYRFITLYNFFRLYSIDYRGVLGDFSVTRYIGSFSLVFIIFILLLTILLLSVLFYKKKPLNLYVYNLLLYVFVLIVFFFCHRNLGQIDRSILDVRVSKALRDFCFIAVIFQVISLIFVIVRTIGFDIKKFDFSSDLQELDISDEDSEEIEVALDFDINNVISSFRKNIRNFKYFYFEHRFLINIIALIIIVFSGLIIYYYASAFSTSVGEGKSFSAGGSTINVTDTYIVDSDSFGNRIVSNDSAVVLIKFQIKGYSKIFNIGGVTLRIGEFSYAHDNDLAKKIDDLGVPYSNEKLTSEFKSYILAFEIPSSLDDKAMKLKFNNGSIFTGGKIVSKYCYVNLNKKDLRKSDGKYNSKLGKSINFNDSILGVSNLKINSYEINDNFKLSYNYCYSKGKCYESFEYLTPSTSGSYFKSLMKIDGEFNLNDFSVYDFFNTYGYINYKIGDDWYKSRIQSSTVKPKKAKSEDLYIEVPLDSKDSSSLYFTFEIRNKSYKYALK